MSSREYLFRPAYMLGRHLIGYEVQQLLAAVAWFSKENEHIGVSGYGEGGMLALYAAAFEERIDAICGSGYIDAQQMWSESFDRSVFSCLLDFGDAELSTLIVPRAIVVEDCRGQEVALDSERGARHARLMHQIDRHSQWLLRRSSEIRRPFSSKLDSTAVAMRSTSRARSIFSSGTSLSSSNCFLSGLQM